MNTRAFCDTAEKLLGEAGGIALRYFRRRMLIEDKGEGEAFDPVTAADREVEACLREGLRRAWPEHGVRGEEFAPTPGGGDFTWLIDPIDGTRAFISGMPLWGILLGLLEADRPRLGFMHQPYLDEIFGGDGEQAWLLRKQGREPLRTRTVGTLAEAVLYTTHPDHFASAADTRHHARLAAQVRLSRYGGDCYSYCMLAAGHVQLVVESGLQDHDILPLVPIVEGAGGVITDWHGNALRGGGQVLASADAGLHAQALAALTG